MNNTIDGKIKGEGLEVSLLENPELETRVKDKPYRLLCKIIVLSFFIIMLISSYVLKFSVSIYSPNINYHVVSSFDTQNFYKANSCDLLIFKTYNNVSDAKIGDVVFYVTNTHKGSGLLVGFDEDIFEVENNSGEIVRISESFVVGKEHKKVAIAGFILAFLDSYTGIIVLNVVLLTLILIFTFGRIKYENTTEGKKLYQDFLVEKKETKRRRKLLNKVKDINVKIAEMLSGDYSEIEEKFFQFKYGLKTDTKNKYKYLLFTIHDRYLVKENLSREEKRQITAIVELLFMCRDIDIDVEYMIIDLLQKTRLYSFNCENFKNNALKYVKNEDNIDNLLNLTSILYVLVYENVKLRDKNLSEIVEEINRKISSFYGIEVKLIQKALNNIMGLIKS